MSYDFELVPYVVGVDEDGLEITSCAVRRTLNLPVVKAKPLSGKNQIAAMMGLRQLLSGKPDGVSHEVATQEVAAALTCSKGRAASVAKATIDRLIVNGHLFLNEGVINLNNHRKSILVNGSDRNGTESVFGKPPLISIKSQTTSEFERVLIMRSAYISSLHKLIETQSSLPPQPLSLHQRFLDWYRSVPEFARNRRFAMSEFETALKTQGKHISPVLMEFGWQRKRI